MCITPERDLSLKLVIRTILERKATCRIQRKTPNAFNNNSLQTAIVTSFSLAVCQTLPGAGFCFII